jgi:hypothetical protein
MRKIFITILILLIAGYCLYSGYLMYRNHQLLNSKNQRILLAYNKSSLGNSAYILKAYESVLTEEGIPFEKVEVHLLMKLAANKIARNNSTVIFPDGLVQHVPEELNNWVKEYLNNSGNIAVIYDAGTKTPRGYYLEKAAFSDITGINYITYNKFRTAAYAVGSLQFDSVKKAEYFQIPPGKIDDDLRLTGYLYGKLTYPVARCEYIRPIPEKSIFASVETPEGKRYPAIVLTQYGNGNVLYVNLQLGRLKANSDDLLLRTILRTFLFKTLKTPHLVNTNRGKGGLVINWHADSKMEWSVITRLIKNKNFNSDLRYSIHIAAGDFLDSIGDQAGFDACGQGKSFAQMLLPLGNIGSHGGWAHNWFAEKLKKNRLWAYEIRRYIKKNKNCLGTIIGYNVLEYSAPLGVHPQPVTTKVLENVGFNSYSYMGDAGSAPNRTFADGKMVSEKVIAFPVLPNGKYASLYEMKKAEIAEDDVQKWLKDLVDYVVEKRTTRLFQSQINDIFNYPKAVRNFLQYAKLKQARGELQIQPMSEIADFFLRFVKTQYTFRHHENDLSILLRNEEGLYGITVAIPRHIYRVGAMRNMTKAEDKDYYYLTVQEDVKEKIILVHGS